VYCVAACADAGGRGRRAVCAEPGPAIRARVPPEGGTPVGEEIPGLASRGAWATKKGGGSTTCGSAGLGVGRRTREEAAVRKGLGASGEAVRGPGTSSTTHTARARKAARPNAPPGDPSRSSRLLLRTNRGARAPRGRIDYSLGVKEGYMGTNGPRRGALLQSIPASPRALPGRAKGGTGVASGRPGSGTHPDLFLRGLHDGPEEGGVVGGLPHAVQD